MLVMLLCFVPENLSLITHGKISKFDYEKISKLVFFVMSNT